MGCAPKYPSMARSRVRHRENMNEASRITGCSLAVFDCLGHRSRWASCGRKFRHGILGIQIRANDRCSIALDPHANGGSQRCGERPADSFRYEAASASPRSLTPYRYESSSNSSSLFGYDAITKPVSYSASVLEPEVGDCTTCLPISQPASTPVVHCSACNQLACDCIEPFTWFHGDYLYWRAHMRSLDYAAIEDGTNLAIGSGETQRIRFDRDGGYRIDLGHMTRSVGA